MKLTDNEKALQIERAANGGQRVELDANGRMNLQPALIENFAGKAVQLRWRGGQLLLTVDDVSENQART
ncbi:MAG: hypothetical protein JNM66_02570 [Bryobacterales bacterium]|nr:hypothetical protein [Bryobacterales bacterium]